MNDLEALSAELEALKQRVSLLEANASQKLKMVYNWHLQEPSRDFPVYDVREVTAATAYEHYIDPAMRMTRNGS